MGRPLLLCIIALLLLTGAGCQGSSTDYCDQTVFVYSAPLEVVSAPRFTSVPYDDQEFRDFVSGWMAGRLISTGAGGTRKSWENYPKRHFTLHDCVVATFVDREQMWFRHHEAFEGAQHVCGETVTIEFTGEDPLDPSEPAHGEFHGVKLTGGYDATLAESMVNDAALQLVTGKPSPCHSAQTLTATFTLTAECSGIIFTAGFQIDLRAHAMEWIAGM